MDIILADSHALFRDALASYIEQAEPDALLIQAYDFYQLLDVLGSARAGPNLIITSIRLPGMGGLSGIRRLRAIYRRIPVLLLTDNFEQAEKEAAIGLGVGGYFPKTLSGKMILQAAYKIMQGERLILPEAGACLDVSPPAHQPARLTPREKQVLGFLLRGASNKEIAASLGLQIVTVKLHVRGLCRKLGAKNRVQAALLAQQDDAQF